MPESESDIRMLVKRLGLLEDQLHQLQIQVSSQIEQTKTSSDHPYIVRVDAILGGEPIIKNTRTPVRAIVEYWKLGDTPEEIIHKLPHLRLAQVFDALSYYDDHRDEIERYIALNRVPVDD